MVQATSRSEAPGTVLTDDSRETEASEAQCPPTEGSNLVDLGARTPLSDTQLLNENSAYFYRVENLLGRAAADRARSAYLKYARSKKVVPAPGSRLGPVRLRGRTPRTMTD